MKHAGCHRAGSCGLPTALALAAAAACAAGAVAAAPSGALHYPQAPRGAVVDDYHGTRVADPYRGFELLDAPATRAWVSAENRLAKPWLDALPQRAPISRRLQQLWNYERFDVPQRQGGRYFYTRNDGRQNQSVLYVADSLEAPGRVLFDANTVRKDATIALARFVPSPDGKFVAYGLSDGGTDWESWHVKRVADGADLPDLLVRTKYWTVSWARDASGFYYDLYPALADGKGDDAGRPDLYFHRLGDAQSSDQLVYAIPDHPTRIADGRVTDDGHYLILSLFEGYKENGVRILDLQRPQAGVQPLFEAWDALYTFAGSSPDELYFRTTNGAAHGRVIAVDPAHPEPAHWREVVPQASDTIATASLIGGRIVVNYVRDAHGAARVFERDGRPVGDVALPGLGTLAGFEGTNADPETFFSYEDFLHPRKILRLDVSGMAVSAYRTPRIAASTDAYVTEQVFYRSKDGTRVPMFITQRRGLPRNGNQPVLLYGYGGFDISLTPAFAPTVLTWLEMGGMYAEANLRGGGEYGEAWHAAGARTQKQNVFDDFIAAAQYLIRERYTRPARLAILGASNGGLLIGATLTQRPELIGAALPEVGVLDMLRYHTASANARQWSSDYGLSENAEDFKALYAYSPVHNVRAGACYPATLITTSDHDDRVLPWHSYKFAATLQRAQGCAKPVLIRIETRAGHGAGKPVWMKIEDYAEQWAFVAQALRMRVGPLGQDSAAARARGVIR